MAPTRTEREWLELVAALFAEPLTALPVERLGPALLATFEAAGSAFCEVVAGAPMRVRTWDAGLGPHAAELTRWSRQRAAEEHPLLRFYLAGAPWRPQQIADVPQEHRALWHARGGYGLAASCSSAHQLSLPLRSSATSSRAFVLGREEPWSRAEHAFAERLWRVLGGLERQVTALASVSGAAPSLAGEIPLTPREQAVLGLLAQGLTAGAIARRLRISPRTVQKHLERCYAKLGVADRLSAVLRAQSLGLV